MFSKHELSSLDRASSVLIHFKFWYWASLSLELPCLLFNIMCSSSVSLFYPNTCRNYWIYKTICQAKPIKFIIKLYTNHNTLLVKRTTYQKAESLRDSSFKVRQHGQQQLYPQYKVCWILCKMVDAHSFP